MFKIEMAAQANIIPANTLHKIFINVVLRQPDCNISG